MVEELATVIHLDTHVVVWLHAGALAEIPKSLRARLDAEDLVVSPAVELELTFLHEIGRTASGGRAVLDELARRIGLRVSDTPFAAVVAAAADLDWTRDPFDRLIVGQSIAEDASLVTRDRTIRKRHARALWR